MLLFVLEVIVVSIFVSILASAIKLVPRYKKWKFILLQQFINTVLMTIILTFFTIFEIYPSWLILAAIIFFVLWLSVKSTNNIVKNEQESGTLNTK